MNKHEFSKLIQENVQVLEKRKRDNLFKIVYLYVSDPILQKQPIEKTLESCKAVIKLCPTIIDEPALLQAYLRGCVNTSGLSSYSEGFEKAAIAAGLSQQQAQTLLSRVIAESHS